MPLVDAHFGGLFFFRYSPIFLGSSPVSSRPLPTGSSVRKDRLYWGLSCLQYLYRQIEDDNAFKAELQQIINQHSPDLNRMNFPTNWTTEHVWQ